LARDLRRLRPGALSDASGGDIFGQKKRGRLPCGRMTRPVGQSALSKLLKFGENAEMADTDPSSLGESL